MKTTQTKRFRGFEKEDGSIVKIGYLNGYSFGDRLLEEVPFKIEVLDDGSLKASIPPSAQSYMADFNGKKWLKEALRLAEQEEFFYENEGFGGDQLLLVQ